MAFVRVRSCCAQRWLRACSVRVPSGRAPRCARRLPAPSTRNRQEYR
ncbi:hypothetical protein B1M_42838 [Burkholderia sp. TJI49]|nr:hypothetical protein B1M_42838 [Burkholderia sp. TJI49]